MENSFVRSVLPWWIVCLLACWTVSNDAVSAQQVASNASSRFASLRVSVAFTDIPVRAAVRAIAKQAGLRASYDETVIPEHVRVTLRVTDMLANDAFRQALRGTGLVAEIQETGNVLIFPGVAVAESGVLAGKIIHAKTKAPIPGAVVTVEGNASKTVTGADGTFRISTDAGEQVIQVRAVGFVRQSKTIVVQNGQTLLMEFVLEPSASVLDEVIVTGTVVSTARKEIPTPITVITADEIEKRNITRLEQLFRGDVPGVLALERGSEVYSSALGSAQQSAIYSRGTSDMSGNANPLKVYVDGVEIFDSDYLGTISTQNIERIEIITGPQAATIYGSGAMGGVMQIFTKKGTSGTRPEIKLSARYGLLESSLSAGRTPTHNDVIAINGSSGPGFSYAITGSYVYSGQWQPLLYNRTYGFSLGATHVAGPLNVNGSISLQNGTNGTAKNPPGMIQRLADGEMDRLRCGLFGCTNTTISHAQRINKSSAQIFSLNATYRMTDKWSHTLVLGRSANAFRLLPEAPTYETPADTGVNHSRRSGARTTWGYNTSYLSQPLSWLASTLTLGANGTMTEGAVLYGQSQSSVGGNLSQPVASLDPDISTWGAFGSWRFGLFQQVFFTMGMRAEQNPAYGKNVKFDFTPTNGLTWTLERDRMTLKLMASYGKATRAPDASTNVDRWIHQPTFDPSYVQSFRMNPDLRPEYETGPQGGFELFWGNLGSVTFNWYREKVTDLMMLISGADSLDVELVATGEHRKWPIAQYQNVGTIAKQGMESTASLAFGGLTIRGTYSWNDSRVLFVDPRSSSSLNWYSGMSWKGIPTHTGSVNIGYSHGKTSISLATSMIGGHNKDLSHHYLKELVSYARLKQYVDDIQSALSSGAEYRQPGYSKSDLNVLHRMNAWSALTLSIMNVGNSFGSEQGAHELYPTLGRSTQIGMTVSFPRAR